MNKYFKLFISIIGLVIFTSCNGQNVSQKETEINSSVDSLYFGYKPPGRKATIFAPELLTIECHDSPIISYDETWMVIGTMEQGVKFYKMIKGRLSLTTNPLNFDIPFSDIPYSFNGMEISQSENRIYFLVWINNDEDFYFIDKTVDGWTPPQKMGKELNSISTHWQFTVASNQNLYLMSRGQGIVVSVFDGNTYLKPEQLIMEDESPLLGGTPFIAPDESYIIYNLDDDLQISYHLNNGKWTTPQNLGPDINSDNVDLCPRISPNGRYLFFISKRNSPDFATYWVEAGFIEELKN